LVDIHARAIHQDDNGVPMAAHLQTSSREFAVADDALAIVARVRLVAVICLGTDVQHLLARHRQVYRFCHGRLPSAFHHGADAKPAGPRAHEQQHNAQQSDQPHRFNPSGGGTARERLKEQPASRLPFNVSQLVAQEVFMGRPGGQDPDTILETHPAGGAQMTPELHAR
jgi:hypothetical protein